MSENEGLAAVVAKLKAKRDALDAAIQLIEQEMGDDDDLAAGGGSGRAPSPWSQSAEIRSDSFFGLSAPDAAKKYLTMTKRPATAQQIADALKEGGFSTRAKSFYSTVYTALERNKADFANLGRSQGWGLTSWYGPRARSNQETEE